MFDKLGWEYEYEPFDMNGWIPDFFIKEKDYLVEIKPYHKWEQWNKKVVPQIETAYLAALDKGEDIYDFLLLGNSIDLQANEDGNRLYTFGYACKPWNVPGGSYVEEEQFVAIDSDSDKPFVLWRFSDYYFASHRDLTELWNQAGNEVQWKKPKKKKGNPNPNHQYYSQPGCACDNCWKREILKCMKN